MYDRWSFELACEEQPSSLPGPYILPGTFFFLFLISADEAPTHRKCTGEREKDVEFLELCRSVVFTSEGRAASFQLLSWFEVTINDEEDSEDNVVSRRSKCEDPRPKRPAACYHHSVEHLPRVLHCYGGIEDVYTVTKGYLWTGRWIHAGWNGESLIQIQHFTATTLRFASSYFPQAPQLISTKPRSSTSLSSDSPSTASLSA